MATSLKVLSFLTLTLWSATKLTAQIEIIYEGEKSKASVIGQDTIPWVFLDEIMVLDKPTFSDAEARLNYLRLKRRVIKVYPYAKGMGERLDSLNMKLAQEKNYFKRKRLTKRYQKYLANRFEPELHKLTVSEGQILCKLIYRETHTTVFQIVREYRSWIQAVGWSATAAWWDIRIKEEYEPSKVEEDALIERILQSAFASGQLTPRTYFYYPPSVE
jgi:hypothetical protein